VRSRQRPAKGGVMCEIPLAARLLEPQGRCDARYDGDPPASALPGKCQCGYPHLIPAALRLPVLPHHDTAGGGTSHRD